MYHREVLGITDKLGVLLGLNDGGLGSGAGGAFGTGEGALEYVGCEVGCPLGLLDFVLHWVRMFLLPRSEINVVQK